MSNGDAEWHIWAVGPMGTACDHGERWGRDLIMHDSILINDLPVITATTWLTSPGDRLGLGNPKSRATYFRGDAIWEAH